MHKAKNTHWGVIEILFLITFVVAIVLILQLRPKWIKATPGRSLQAYPLPGTPYPHPDGSLAVTPQQQPSPTIEINTEIPVEPGPPPGWPTDQAWPPFDLTPTIIVENPPTPFPTPNFEPKPKGDRPDQLQRILYPYYPQIDSPPILQVVQIDQKIQRWQVFNPAIDLIIPKPQLGFEPGPILWDFHLSPNYRWLVADFAYVGSQLVDLSTGKIFNPFIDEQSSNWHFLTWDTVGESLVSSTNRGYQKVDLIRGGYEAFPLVNFSTDEIYLNAIAISPDNQNIADAVIYPATKNIRNREVAEIGLRKDINGEREILFKLEGGIYFFEHSLSWSPDGSKLIWIVRVSAKQDRSDSESQLWVYDLGAKQSYLLEILSKDTQYYQRAAWSPDGKSLAVIKEGHESNNDIYSDLVLIDLSKGSRTTIEHFIGNRISQVHWSSDTQWIAYTLSRGNYGEVWVTDLTGSHKFPIAGPTPPRAPFIWLP
jgi:hypothetical protein